MPPWAIAWGDPWGVQSRTALFSCVLPSWVANGSKEADHDDDQVNLVVQHLCEQLHLALRLKDSEAHPPNAKDIGFDPASVRTVLLTGLRSAGVTIHHEAAGRAKSRRGPKRKTRDRTLAPCLSWVNRVVLAVRGLLPVFLPDAEHRQNRPVGPFVPLPDSCTQAFSHRQAR